MSKVINFELTYIEKPYVYVLTYNCPDGKTIKKYPLPHALPEEFIKNTIEKLTKYEKTLNDSFFQKNQKIKNELTKIIKTEYPEFYI